MSATGTGSPARSRVSTVRATEVLSPEKEKVKGASPGRSMARGKAKAAGSPPTAAREIAGPPG